MALSNLPKKSLAESVDIISGLIDDLLLVILSFLDIKDAVQTRMLSKRWRYLWSSLRNLNVDQRLYTCFRKYPFTNSMDKVITLFLHVLPEVQKVHLKVSSELPQCLLTWKSIRILKLKGVNGYLWLRNPHSVDLPVLKDLYLTRLVLDVKLLDDFLSKCPVLEVLSLKCCEFVAIEGLNISSSRLKKLIIVSYGTNYGCSKHYDIKISAPRLTFLKCRDYIRKTFSLDNLSALVSADIDMKKNESFGPLGTKEEYANRVVKFLDGLYHLESLSLSAPSLKTFSSALVELQRLPTKLSNLRNLKITASPNDACSHVVQLLKISPNIMTLHLNISWTSFESYQGRLYWDEPLFYPTIMEVNWEADPEFQCMLDDLRYVEVRNFLGCENEIKLLKVLLINATSLEKIKINLAQVWPHIKLKMIWAVSNMLQRVPRASPEVHLEFVNFGVLTL
ncbi:hypothetical protein ACHQM5_027844 [Ranunculus cassubicifolius]